MSAAMVKKTMSDSADFNDNTQWRKFLAIANEEIPTKGVLNAMMQKAIFARRLHPEKLDGAWRRVVALLKPRSPWQLLESWRKTQRMSPEDLASALGVSREHMGSLKQCRAQITTRRSIAVFCREFSRQHPHYPRAKLMRLLARAHSR